MNKMVSPESGLISSKFIIIYINMLNFESILFYLFSAIALIASIMVINSKNPVHSVLFLILVFCNSAGLFILLGVEFLAITFIIVYVGAIAILFLFVVMMLNIKLVELNENMLRYLPIGALIGIIFLFEIFLVLENNFISLNYKIDPQTINYIWDNKITSYTNIELIGNILYTNNFYLFLVASLILLVAMIGAIILTLYMQTNVKRQDVFKQTSRHFSRSIILKT
jgi:NADH:ubiquinone oxidoreductase subunit 6 (subunit J)